MALSSTPNSYLVIAAIDFGTTCTGYAYHVRKGDSAHITDINADQAWMGSAEMGLQAPTTVLLQPNKKFHSFGFEAETEYKSLSIKNEHKNWFYFRHFKMKLHHEPELSRDTLLEDAEGKPMKALTVFTEAIRYIKEHLKEKLNESLRSDVAAQEIQWVLTVPAIWRESAKQFMRESASGAGIPNKQLLLALEPESAAIYCKELAINKCGGVQGEFLRAFDPGEKYIIVDLGGGTVDTTGHEVQRNGTLKELHAATGGPWGGQLVNEAFEKFIEVSVTKPVLDEFRENYCSAWIEFQRDFEKIKRQFTPKTERSEMQFPRDLEILLEKKGVDFAKQLEKNDVKLTNHYLILSKTAINIFFNHAIYQVKTHIQFLLKKKELNSVKSLLLVGGFSESRVVGDGIRSSFRSLRVVSPENGSVAILKGAVMFGYNQNVIAVRVSPFTYGVHTRKFYNSAIHDSSRKRRNPQGKLVVDNAFDKHIEKGECVYVGETRLEKKYVTISTKATKNVFWKLYQSTDRDPKFCDEPSCRYLGRLSITIPSVNPDARVSLRVSMTCRGTELEATVVDDVSDQKCSTHLEFLEIDTSGCTESEIEATAVE